jgi:hypothetical protein
MPFGVVSKTLFYTLNSKIFEIDFSGIYLNLREINHEWDGKQIGNWKH